MASTFNVPQDYLSTIDLQNKCMFNENEIRSFIYYWFALFDKRVDVNQFLCLIADEGLDMEYPGDPRPEYIHSHKEFEAWYKSTSIESNTHKVEKVEIKHITACEYEVDLEVRWQAEEPGGKYEDYRVQQMWKLDCGIKRVSPIRGQWPRILRCIVKKI
jgi:hypothetical protein